MAVNNERNSSFESTPTDALDISDTSSDDSIFDQVCYQRERLLSSSDDSWLSFPQNRPAPSPLPVPPSTIPPLPPATSRRPKQQQGFYLRNSLGFQTIPPGAFADRRSIPVSSPLAVAPSSVAPVTMNEAMVLHFEPTRRNAAKVEHLQSLPTTATSTNSVANRFRTTTKRARVTTPKSQVTGILTSTPSSRQAGLNGGHRSRSSAREVNLAERSFQRSQPLVDARQKENITSTTAKPFRIYYFEPKRKKPRKSDFATDSPNGQRNRIASKKSVVNVYNESLSQEEKL
ncbi:uncharacterized protein TNCV_1606231 [Trichonephila clavipes]|nr:uncharacterized protein TNCV_1606231 [Trichonephila clavipes]